MAMTKEKIAARRRIFREANKEKIAASKKAYYETNKEEILAKQKDYKEANKEKRLAKQKDYDRANKDQRKAYLEANKEEVAAYKAKRRALKRKLVPVHLRDCPHEKKRIVKTYKLRNIISVATGVQHHVDHMWPLKDGGPHWSGNLQVIPAAENLSKSASVCEDTKATIIKSLYTFETESAI